MGESLIYSTNRIARRNRCVVVKPDISGASALRSTLALPMIMFCLEVGSARNRFRAACFS